MNNALTTLQGLNQARQQFLNNQALQATVPYAGQQAQAQVGLTQGQANLANAQANFFPMTAKAGLLGAYGRLASAQAATDNSNLEFLKSPQGQALMAGNTPEGQAARQQFMDIQKRQQSLAAPGLIGGAAAMLSGAGMPNNSSSQPAAPLVNTQSPFMQILQKLTGSSSAPQAAGQQNAAQMLTGATVTPQSSFGQPLPMGSNPGAVESTGGMTPGQPLGGSDISRVAQVMNSGRGFSGVPPQTNAPTGDSTIQDAASNISAKNALVNPQLQQRYISAKSLAQTFKTVNDEIGNPAITFAPYMGAKGQARYASDLASQAAGSNVPLLQKFQAFKSIVPVSSDQFTKFYGGSIAPEAQENLHVLQNPTTWKDSPGSAVKAYNMLNEIISNEGGNYAAAVNKTNDFASVAPKFDVASTHAQLLNNLSYAPDIVRALTPSQQQQLRAYNENLKRGANG